MLIKQTTLLGYPFPLIESICTAQLKALCVVQTHILVVDSHSFGADMFMCADMLVDTPVTPPTTADTPLASGREHSNVKKT